VSAKRARARDVLLQDSVSHWLQRYKKGRSGDKKEYSETFLSRYESYEKYKEGGGTAGQVIFSAAWTLAGVKKAKHTLFDFFSCMKCNNWEAVLQRMETEIAHLREDTQMSALKQKRLDEVVADFASSRIYLATFSCQRDSYQAQRLELKQEELFVTVDFGALQVMSGSRTLPDLVLVLHWLNTDNELQHAYLDCLSLSNKHERKTWCYVQSTFDELFRSGFFGSFSTLIWWSDTGPNHFRVSSTLLYFRLFQARTRIKVMMQFFVPRHGHSQCDGHLGSISRKVTRASKKLHKSFEEWDAYWVRERVEELKFTTIVDIDVVQKDDLVSTLKGISNYLVFTFDDTAPDSVDCSKMCGGEKVRLVFERKPDSPAEMMASLQVQHELLGRVRGDVSSSTIIHSEI
jgi:hypothetical protein